MHQADAKVLVAPEPTSDLAPEVGEGIKPP